MRVVVTAAVVTAVFAVAQPSAAAAPPTDDGGYVDSTARCVSPSTVVVFGSTDASRVAVCKTPDGRYEYRGVRISDGARLVVPAEGSGDDSFVADNNGISYRVTPKSLVVGDGATVIREEPMVDFHGRQAPPPPPSPSPPSPSASPTPTTPLPPPLAAERGGGQS